MLVIFGVKVRASCFVLRCFRSRMWKYPLKDMVQGMGTIIYEDNSKRKAIYWRDRRVCFLDGMEAIGGSVMIVPTLFRGDASSTRFAGGVGVGGRTGLKYGLRSTGVCCTVGGRLRIMLLQYFLEPIEVYRS